MFFPGIEKDLVFVVAVLKFVHLLDDSMIGRHRPIGLRLMLSVCSTTDGAVVDALVVSKDLDLVRLERDGGVQVARLDPRPHHVLEERPVAPKVVGAHL